jgi:hypothetical protein
MGAQDSLALTFARMLYEFVTQAHIFGEGEPEHLQR